MTLKIGAAVSLEDETTQAGTAAARAATEALGGEPADLALVFASGDHLAAPEEALEAVHAVLEPSVLAGCAAGGVLGPGCELEGGTALSVWAAAFGGKGRATPFHATVVDDGDEAVIQGLPSLSGSSGAILLADPYSFPADLALGALAEEAPGIPVLGGISSAYGPEGPLFLDREVHEAGAVGVHLDGVQMLPCLSHGP